MTVMNVHQFLKDHIRTVPDWPAPGVQFRDITPLLQDLRVFRVLIDAFVHRYMAPHLRPDVVAGLDARLTSITIQREDLSGAQAAPAK